MPARRRTYPAVQAAALVLAMLFPWVTWAADVGSSPLFQQRLDEMALQFEGKIGADQRNRVGIGEEQAFIFPSEAVSACVGSGCVGSACGASGCAGSGCAGSACGGSGCGGSACGGSACGGSACGLSVCVGSACAGSACGASGCIGSACGQSGCVGSACSQSGCVGSACKGCQGQQIQRDGTRQFARVGGDVIQAACPFARDEAMGSVQIAGFEVERRGASVTVSWIASGGPLERYRVIREQDGLRRVIAEGPAPAQTIMHATDAGAGTGATYIVEVLDATGWITTVSSGGETLRRPSLPEEGDENADPLLLASAY